MHDYLSSKTCAFLGAPHADAYEIAGWSIRCWHQEGVSQHWLCRFQSMYALICNNLSTDHVICVPLLLQLCLYQLTITFRVEYAVTLTISIIDFHYRCIV